MGYCVGMELKNIVIPAEQRKQALDAINDLFNQPEKMGAVDWNGKNRTLHFAWIQQPPKGKFFSLEKALEEWRYSSQENEDGSVTVLYFEGEKLGDDNVLWSALAPFMNDDSKIICHGEDDAVWKWSFPVIDGTRIFNESPGHVVFDDGEEL